MREPLVIQCQKGKRNKKILKQGIADDTNTLMLRSRRKCSVKGGGGWGVRVEQVGVGREVGQGRGLEGQGGGGGMKFLESALFSG